MDLRTRGGGRVSWDEVREWHGHMYTTKCRMGLVGSSLMAQGEHLLVLCDHLERWDREDGREMQEGGDIRICVYV